MVVLLCTISVVAPLRDGSKGLLLCMAAPHGVALLALSTYAFPVYYLLPAACLTLALPAAGLVAVLDLLSGSKRIFDWRRAVLWVSNLFLAYLIALEIDWFNIRMISGS